MLKEQLTSMQLDCTKFYVEVTSLQIPIANNMSIRSGVFIVQCEFIFRTCIRYITSIKRVLCLGF